MIVWVSAKLTMGRGDRALKLSVIFVTFSEFGDLIKQFLIQLFIFSVS